MLDMTSADGRRPVGRYDIAYGLIAILIVSVVDLWAQVPGSAGHDHLAEVACVDTPPGEKRPEFWLLQRGYGYRTSFHAGVRLLASAHVSQSAGCGRRQEPDGNRRGGRRAGVAL